MRHINCLGIILSLLLICSCGRLYQETHWYYYTENQTEQTLVVSYYPSAYCDTSIYVIVDTIKAGERSLLGETEGMFRSDDKPFEEFFDNQFRGWGVEIKDMNDVVLSRWIRGLDPDYSIGFFNTDNWDLKQDYSSQPQAYFRYWTFIITQNVLSEQ